MSDTFTPIGKAATSILSRIAAQREIDARLAKQNLNEKSRRRFCLPQGYDHLDVIGAMCARIAAAYERKHGPLCSVSEAINQRKIERARAMQRDKAKQVILANPGLPLIKSYAKLAGVSEYTAGAAYQELLLEGKVSEACKPARKPPSI
jgi:hypothetical protein